jgi:hypothetical protein
MLAIGMPARFPFFLGVLHHHDELGDAVCLNIILGHIGAEGNHIMSMQTPIVGVKEGDDVERRDLRIESIGVFEVVVQNLVDNVMEEFGHAMLGYLVTSIVIKAGFMGSLRTNTDGIVPLSAIVLL